jgi:hypothetical protein
LREPETFPGILVGNKKKMDKNSYLMFFTKDNDDSGNKNVIGGK